MITIQTQIEVSTAVLGDVAITAAEGGIGYWSQIISGYRPSSWADTEVPEDFVFYEIVENEPSGMLDPNTSVFITPELLANGLAHVLRERHIEDISEVDAAVADEIVQYGVFGELVFS